MSAAPQQLVGRPAELGTFDEVLAGLEDGHPAAIMLVGEPGIGKTRLLAELGARADARGHLVLSGSASELERDLPFWVFVDALDEYADGLEPERLEQLDESARMELAHVFPGLSTLGTGGGTALQNERYRTHRAISDLLEALASVKPLVLILDDLHWADSGTVELIGALLRRLPSAPVLLAMAIRPRQVPERLSTAFERADRSGRLVRHDLGALSLPETRELLGSHIDPHAAVALYEESGGNPFYAEQLARSFDRSPASTTAIADISLAGAYVPPAVAAALSEELALLTAGARLALDGAAVAGDPFEPELMAAAADIGEADAFSALDELLRRDLVRQTDVPRRFRFRHPLVRRAIYDASPGGWRLGAHQRSADALAERGVPAASVAHHVERSARHGDSAAVAILREAGSAAAQRAPATAARWFRAALRTLSETASAEERVELLTALAGAQAATGQFIEARSALLEAMALLPENADSRAHTVDRRVCGTRAAARPARRGSRPPRRRARFPCRSRFTRRRRPVDHARDGRVLPAGARRRARLGRACAGGRPPARGRTADRSGAGGPRPRLYVRGRARRGAGTSRQSRRADRCDARRAARDPSRRDRVPDRRRGVHGSLRRRRGARAPRTRRRACHRSGLPRSDVDASLGDGDQRAGPADRVGRAHGRGDRGLEARRQRPDAGLGPGEPRVRRRAARRARLGDLGGRGERGDHARPRRRLRLDARRRDARNRSPAERRGGQGGRAVRQCRRRRVDAPASRRLAREVPRSADARLADARQARGGCAGGGVRRRGRRRDGTRHAGGMGAACRSSRRARAR